MPPVVDSWLSNAAAASGIARRLGDDSRHGRKTWYDIVEGKAGEIRDGRFEGLLR